jgi:hypothetical protein
MKEKIYWKLTFLRDKDWMPDVFVGAIDYMRYEWFYTPYDY